ncbi:MAG: hypothetical protein HY343_08015 [Lentisphaerae bacterium]|nr:hypothetical protein [Lentisphaerota bacterium]
MEINVNKKFIVNGHEYGRVEDMPEELRRAYEKAMGGASGRNPAIVKTNIVFNGKEYQNADDMPEEDRRLYDMAMAAVKAGDPAASPGRRPPPSNGMEIRASLSRKEPTLSIHFGGRALNIIIGILILLALLYHFGRSYFIP